MQNGALSGSGFIKLCHFIYIYINQFFGCSKNFQTTNIYLSMIVFKFRIYHCLYGLEMTGDNHGYVTQSGVALVL